MFKVGDRVWFTKSMRLCKVVKVLSDGYIVEVMDSGKRNYFQKKMGLSFNGQ